MNHMPFWLRCQWQFPKAILEINLIDPVNNGGRALDKSLFFFSLGCKVQTHTYISKIKYRLFIPFGTLLE